MEEDDIYAVDVISDGSLWLHVGKEVQNESEKASDTGPRSPDAGELTWGL